MNRGNLDKKIELTTKELKESKDKISKLNMLLGTLNKVLKEDNLNEENRNTYASLLESYTIDILNNLDYKSQLVKEKENRHQRIKEANQTIRELEEKLGKQDLESGIGEKINYLYKVIEKWWDKELGFGFLLYDSFKITSNANVEVRLTFNLRNIKENQDKLKENFEICYEKSDPYIIDNQNNRQRIFDIIKKEFPTADLRDFEIRNRYNGIKFELHSVIASIDIEEVVKFKNRKVRENNECKKD